MTHDFRRRNDQRQMLREKKRHSMTKTVVRHPDSSVLRDGELATQNGKVDGFQSVRIVDVIHRQRWLADTVDSRATHDRRLELGNVVQSFLDSGQ